METTSTTTRQAWIAYLPGEVNTNALHLYLVGYERIMLVEHLSMSYPGSPAQPAAQGG